MYYRLIALDIDGTLVNSRGELTPAVLQMVHRVHRQGSQIVITSGRNHLGVQRIIDLLGLELWYISSGGAQMGNTKSCQVLHQIALAAVDASRVIQIARQAQVGIFLEKPGHLYWEGSRFHLDHITSILGLKITDVPDMLEILDGDPLKVTLIQENEALRRVERLLQIQTPDLNLTYSMPIYLEVTRRGVTKGAALCKLAEHLKIPLEYVAAVGDGENDVSMFEVAGLSVAMGNAPQTVRRFAHLVAPTNDQDGVAWALAQMDVAHVPGA